MSVKRNVQDSDMHMPSHKASVILNASYHKIWVYYIILCILVISFLVLY